MSRVATGRAHSRAPLRVHLQRADGEVSTGEIHGAAATVPELQSARDGHDTSQIEKLDTDRA